MQAVARTRESACFTEGTRRHIRRPFGGYPPPPWRQHKNVTFRKSAVKLEEKSYVWTRPEKSSGGEGLRPPPKECSKHRTMTKVMSADGAKHSPPGHHGAPDWLKGGSSCWHSRTTFGQRYFLLKTTNWTIQSFPHHDFWRSFEWFTLEILKLTGTFETRARFGHFSWCWKIKFLEIKSRWL